MKTDRVTLYFSGEMMGNYHRIECRSAEISLRAYAQFSAAIEVRFMQKGCRRVRGFMQTDSPSLLVLEGWGHPQPAGIFDESTREEVSPGVTFTKGRHSGFSPGWRLDFDAMIGEHVEKTGAKIVADFREHNPHAPLAPAESAA